MTVDTRQAQRRTLRFENYDQLLAEAQRLVAAPRVASRGNWTVGQAIAHLAGAMKMSLDGTEIRAPILLRWIGPLIRNRILRGPMPAGHAAPERVQRELVPDMSITPTAALAQLQAVVQRLQAESQRAPHPVFGRLSREQWDQLHWRHAELHLSFHDAVQ